MGDRSPPAVPIWLHGLGRSPLLSRPPCPHLPNGNQISALPGMWEDEVRAGGEVHEYKGLFSGSGEERKWRPPLHLPSPQGCKGSRERSWGPPTSANSPSGGQGLLSAAGRRSLENSEARAHGAVLRLPKETRYELAPRCPKPSCSHSPVTSPSLHHHSPTPHTHTHTQKTVPPLLAHPIPTK